MSYKDKNLSANLDHQTICELPHVMIPAVVGLVEDGFCAFLAPDEFGMGEEIKVALGEVAAESCSALVVSC